MEYIHATSEQKIILCQIKLFSPGAAVSNASSGPAGGTVGWGTAQNKNKNYLHLNLDKYYMDDTKE